MLCPNNAQLIQNAKKQAVAMMKNVVKKVNVEEEINYAIKNAFRGNKKNKNTTTLNDENHFNIINDIKIDLDEIKNSTNNKQKEKIKKFKL